MSKNNLIEQMPRLKEAFEKHKDSTFLGKRLSGMTKDELIGVIGWLQESEKKRDDGLY